MKYSEYVIVALLLLTIMIMYTLIHLENVLGLPVGIAVMYIFIFFALLFAIGIVFVILLVMIVGTTFVFSKINQARINIEKRKIEQEQLTKYALALEKLSNEMSDFNHDYINILVSLHGYIEKGDQLLLKNYFQETIRHLIKH